MNIKGVHHSTPPSVSSGEIFRCLADETRRQILGLLLSEELNVSQLVFILGQPQPTVSRHLKLLRACALVRDRRIGNSIVYQAAPTTDVAADVAPVLLDWIRKQTLPAPLRNRLERVLNERRNDSVSFFDRMGQKWDDLRTAAFGEAPAIEAMISLLPRDWTVADLGAGTGHLLPVLAGQFARVIAIEPSATMIECVRRRVANLPDGNVEVVQGDFARLPLPDATCDLAIACLVLHHVSRPDEALAEAHRILRPGGRLLVIEQESHENQRFYDEMQDLWWGFDPRDLSATVRAAGFTAVETHRLVTPQSAPRQVEAPKLFCLTATRGNSGIVRLDDE